MIAQFACTHTHTCARSWQLTHRSMLQPQFKCEPYFGTNVELEDRHRSSRHAHNNTRIHGQLRAVLTAASQQHADDHQREIIRRAVCQHHCAGDHKRYACNNTTGNNTSVGMENCERIFSDQRVKSRGSVRSSLLGLRRAMVRSRDQDPSEICASGSRCSRRCAPAGSVDSPIAIVVPTNACMHLPALQAPLRTSTTPVSCCDTGTGVARGATGTTGRGVPDPSQWDEPVPAAIGFGSAAA